MMMVDMNLFKKRRCKICKCKFEKKYRFQTECSPLCHAYWLSRVFKTRAWINLVLQSQYGVEGFIM
jgi:hypothetical protein